MSAPAIGAESRYIDLDDLICSGCGEQVNCEPPDNYRTGGGRPTPDFSQRDGSALCSRPDGAPAEPIEGSW
jgi:hypothetical protein